jgi:hypothetical protein
LNGEFHVSNVPLLHALQEKPEAAAVA